MAIETRRKEKVQVRRGSMFIQAQAAPRGRPRRAPFGAAEHGAAGVQRPLVLLDGAQLGVPKLRPEGGARAHSVHQVCWCAGAPAGIGAGRSALAADRQGTLAAPLAARRRRTSTALPFLASAATPCWPQALKGCPAACLPLSSHLAAGKAVSPPSSASAAQLGGRSGLCSAGRGSRIGGGAGPRPTAWAACRQRGMHGPAACAARRCSPVSPGGRRTRQIQDDGCNSDGGAIQAGAARLIGVVPMGGI